jgi:hypothetical protein
MIMQAINNKKKKDTATFIFLSICATVWTTGAVYSKPVDKEKAGKAADTFLKIEQLRQEKQEEKLAKEGKKILMPIQNRKAEITIPVYGEDNQILAWVTELDPEGYIITSADDKIRPVIGYSFKGKFPFEDSKDNVLLHLVQWDIEGRLKALKSDATAIECIVQSNNDSWDIYTTSNEITVQSFATDSQTQWPDPIYGHDGWITTNWHQNFPYNKYCPDSPGFSICPVGCVATAMSQIIYYWKYPSQVSFDASNDTYTSKDYDDYDFDGKDELFSIDIDQDAGAYNFPSFGVLNSELNVINYNNNEDEVAYLCFGAGIKLKMDYGQRGSSADTSYAAVVLQNEFDYGSARRDFIISVPGAWGRRKARVIENIKNGWPAQIAIAEGNVNGHSVVVDGYRSDDYFHINTGWSDSNSDTWYDLPYIDTTQYGKPYNFNVIRKVVYDICPYQGWSQWGADEKNSFSTIYSAPTAENNTIVSKWYVQSDSSYYFNGLVVGTGNRIYASCIPDTQGYNPSVWVINQYGQKEKQITISEEIQGLTYPLQNSRGEVFVGADSGKVYRINPKDNSYVEIFNTGQQLFKPVKIDSGGRIYVCNLYKMFCISRTGYKYWEFSAPDIDGWFFRPIPAIDEVRNRVYVSYYNRNTDIAYILTVNRLTGKEITSCQKSITGVTRDFNSFSSPSIGPDGTVYSGCQTYLYAFNPDSTLSVKWVKNLTPSYVIKSPTIGRDGTLYISHWVDLGGGDYNLRLGARNSTNGNLIWQYSQGQSNIIDDIREIYVSSDKVVSFWYVKDSGSSKFNNTLHAIKDNTTSHAPLWNKNFGQQGGQTTFGPGATLYSISSHSYGNTIHAISDGPVGDPDGGGMGFTDNAAPAMPFDPSPIDEANDISSTVTLSWSCTDPEAHSLKYSLFVGESGYDMVPVATDIASTTYQLADLKPGTGYFWKVIATDGQAPSEGPTWVFSTKSNNEIKIISWEVSAMHGATEIVSEVNDGYVEPRANAFDDINIHFNQEMDTSIAGVSTVSIMGLSGGVFMDYDVIWKDPTCMTVQLNYTIPDMDHYTITVNPIVKSAEGVPVSGDIDLNISVLKGDVNGNLSVNSLDMLASRAHAREAVNADNCVCDVNRNGSINTLDLLMIRSCLRNELDR